MAENATLIERTDAFMRPDGRSFGGRRRRSFVATTTNQANTAANTSDPAEEDEDIPVLTEVVSPELPAPEAPKIIDEEALLAISPRISYTTWTNSLPSNCQRSLKPRWSMRRSNCAAVSALP